jgi:hypothetical protein
MPASLLIEIAAQAATILLECSSAFHNKAFVGYISHAKFRREVVPGHEILVESSVEHSADDAALLRSSIRQRDSRCASIKLGMVLSPLETFLERRYMADYLDLYRVWLQGSLLQGFERNPLLELGDALP